MLRYFSFIAGAAAGALYYSERRKRIALERLGAACLESLLDAIDANNPETGAHVRRVAQYSLTLACAADLDERMQHRVERVALFHDIGKIDEAITDIVKEPKKLTAEERRAIRQHPGRGADVLKPLSAFFPELPEGVLSHHERWDGTGYPRNLTGSEIPLEARIVSIADTFDAITAARAYTPARTLETAGKILEDGRATQFDPDLVDLYLSPPVMQNVEKILRRENAPKKARGMRRKNAPATSLPDITFRWRAPSPLLRRAGQTRP
jgi:HD-GYP domain-containing protein (c-di-GMP phosphodiesterase class II)